MVRVQKKGGSLPHCLPLPLMSVTYYPIKNTRHTTGKMTLICSSSSWYSIKPKLNIPDNHKKDESFLLAKFISDQDKNIYCSL